MNSLCLLLAVLGADPEPVVIGSKSFTESVVLGELAYLLGKNANVPVKHIKELGGTRLLWDALRGGEVDVYPEYTGTIRQEIFSGEALPDTAAIIERLGREGIMAMRPLGFNNTYALALKAERAKELGVVKISDLTKLSNLKFGFSNEFMDRGDGWPSLRRKYSLEAASSRGMEHSLAYSALDAGDIDVIDIYSTDPNIRRYGLTPLVDDRGHFPRYDALYLYRADLQQRAPALLSELKRLEGRIDDAAMLDLNQQVELKSLSEQRVASIFLEQTLGVEVAYEEETMWDRLLRTTLGHLYLVSVSLGAAIFVAVPLGVISAKNSIAAQFIIGGAEVIQTIPGLALLVFMSVGFRRVGLPTIGPLPVIVALFMYSLLPIIRNTMTGLTSIPKSLHESATALGLGPLSRLRLIELPMASRLILAGIKTTAVINVGYAALGGLIGAGGYGQPIMTGLRLNSESLMMEGAIPAALLALVVKGVFELSEIYLVPKGLRLQAAGGE